MARAATAMGSATRRGRRTTGGRMGRAGAALLLLTTLLVSAGSATATAQDERGVGGPPADALLAPVGDGSAGDAEPGVDDGSDEKLRARARSGLISAERGEVSERAISFDDCLNSVYLDTIGDASPDVDATGIFSDCRTTIFNAITVAPLTAGNFDAFGAYFDVDENLSTGCNGYEFLVAGFDLEGNIAEVQETPTCDPADTILRTEIVSVFTTVLDDGRGYIEIIFPSVRILGDEGPFYWYSVLQPAAGASDFTPNTGDLREVQVPITPNAPGNVSAVPAASGGGADVFWDQPFSPEAGGDIDSYLVQYRAVGNSSLVSASDEFEPAPPPVVGGGSIAITQAPWSVALFFSGSLPAESQFCGGVLVAPTKVLTAAHCVDTELPEDIQVLVGQTTLTTATADGVAGVISIDVHPDFGRRPSLTGDVAVLTLNRSFNITPLPRINTTASFPPAGRPATVTGWGAVQFGADSTLFADQLQRGVLQILAGPGEGCGSWDASLFVPGEHICAGVPGGGVDACFGDSGGGLVTTDGVNFDLVGIVSFGFGVCGDADFPGAYARVSTYASWINQSVNSPGWSNDTVTCGGTRCVYRVPDLVPGQRYEFRVAAVNLAGAGDFSAATFTTGGSLFCQGRMVTMVARPGVVTNGTSGPDVIWGTDGPDDIRSGAGADRICARGGDDTVQSGGGADRISLGAGNDNANAGKGNDRVDGDAGADVIRGKGGDDTINGGGGKDEIVGGGGGDTINGNGGKDIIDGGRGNDRINGGGKRDTLNGGGGDDNIRGGGGGDRIRGGSGNDTINGDKGNDRIDGGGDFDTCTGAGGTDTINANCERRFA